MTIHSRSIYHRLALLWLQVVLAAFHVRCFLILPTPTTTRTRTTIIRNRQNYNHNHHPIIGKNIVPSSCRRRTFLLQQHKSFRDDYNNDNKNNLQSSEVAEMNTFLSNNSIFEVTVQEMNGICKSNGTTSYDLTIINNSNNNNGFPGSSGSNGMPIQPKGGKVNGVRQENNNINNGTPHMTRYQRITTPISSTSTTTTDIDMQSSLSSSLNGDNGVRLSAGGQQQQQQDSSKTTKSSFTEATTSVAQRTEYRKNNESNNNMTYSSSSSSNSIMMNICPNGCSNNNDHHFDGNNGNESFLDNAILTEKDIIEIEKYWDQLMPTVSYLGTEQVARIYKALKVAYIAHNGQMRKSGEPFIIHPVEVALLLSGLKMDSDTVCAGLLHDTVEDTELTFDEVEMMFGCTVRGIVEGETKVSKLPKQLATFEQGEQDGSIGEKGGSGGVSQQMTSLLSAKDEQEQHKQADEQAENLRQMFVAMTDDYRIIIVKLADRLHNMRTLQHMKPQKQIKISRETLDIFAPLAHRMGIWQFKSELEDIAFMYLYPTEYKRLHRRLQQHADRFKQTLHESKSLLQRRLNEDPTLQQQAVSVQVMGRTKEIYSLWHKMETKNIRNLDNVIDVVALRVIITPKTPTENETEMNKSGSNNGSIETDRGVWLCYHVLGLVQHLHGFQPVPTRVKDYISFPKPNGYQSLHTALILNGQTIEVQIRTCMMHQVAEYGMASHWAYTEQKRRALTPSSAGDLYNTPWLSSIKEWQNDRISSRDFVDSVRRELLGKRVFVFLRNGKILNLARGATAIDAAFQIHTEVGLKMHGVEVNGRPVPFSYILKNGDVVSILTGHGKPATEWMRHAKSRSTRSKLRAYFRAQQKDSLRETGKVLLQDYLFRHKPYIEKMSKTTVPVPGSDSFEQDLHVILVKSFRVNYENVDDLFVAIGKKHLDRSILPNVVSQLFGISKKNLSLEEDEEINKMENSMRQQQQPVGDILSAVSNIGRMLVDHNGRGKNDSDNESLIEPIPAELSSAYSSFDNLLSTMNSKVEYADPEHLCPHCLPVHGDKIVGTRSRTQLAGVTSATVHRIGCPHAQRAFNNAWSERRINPSFRKSISNGTNIVDNIVESVRLRQAKRQHPSLEQLKSRSASKLNTKVDEIPVKLEWFDLDDYVDSNTHDFMAEIVVHAVDRKLLLADCSEIVSDMSEIVKTGSQTSNDDATLVFLVKVDSISHIQAVMDRLCQVRSVMSVERRFGSELL